MARPHPRPRYYAAPVLTAALFLADGPPAAARAPEMSAPLTQIAGTWAASTKGCPHLDQRVTIITEYEQVTDGRAAENLSCRVKRATPHRTGVALALICDFGSDGPLSFETTATATRTGPKTLTYTTRFVGGEPHTEKLVLCERPNEVATKPGTPDPTQPRYILPPLRTGEYYEGQAYPADYDERRQELLGAKAKPLPRTKDEVCLRDFCRKYPEIRACYADYCVGRWERADGATLDYVVKPETLEVLKIVCRDTCSADEIRPHVR
ncbi:hypothetical protein DK419_26625 [Methylobacterium terrae]|uniref:Uncharacterized protein n=1 Tax=Methylobacterium terrae TaxID=2202827 RepID=A0A2U8WW32_9HYPH|nr:hypothetical protein [Methylobacterium terrae]AWN49472.1 hypothetical protein DK419_26625 [Methylobacterium terrae]